MHKTRLADAIKTILTFHNMFEDSEMKKVKSLESFFLPDIAKRLKMKTQTERNLVSLC